MKLASVDHETASALQARLNLNKANETILFHLINTKSPRAVQSKQGLCKMYMGMYYSAYRFNTYNMNHDIQVIRHMIHPEPVTMSEAKSPLKGSWSRPWSPSWARR
jgi:hypothetical protein